MSFETGLILAVRLLFSLANDTRQSIEDECVRARKILIALYGEDENDAWIEKINACRHCGSILNQVSQYGTCFRAKKCYIERELDWEKTTGANVCIRQYRSNTFISYKRDGDGFQVWGKYPNAEFDEKDALDLLYAHLGETRTKEVGF